MVENRLESNLRSQPSATVTPSDAAAKRAISRLLGMKRPRSDVGGVGSAGGLRGQNNDSEKPPSNPRGWPDRYKEADLEERPHRRIILNAEQEFWFCNNYVRTSKYTLLDFLPRFLMEEFHPRRKMANVYFLVLAALQTIREISNTFGVPTILIPLSIVVLIDAVFAILEDVARHRADAKANASPTRVLELKRSSGRFRRVAWSDVQVGDILLLKNRESVPADLLVLATHEPNPRAKTGMCYVETKSLDGETNLKIRQAIRPTIGLVSSPRDAASLRGIVEMEHPNKLIESFNGSIEVEGAGVGGGAVREAIQTRNLLLRGCVLRNTRWIVGLVLNTGPDTKIVMSSLEPPQKSSRLEQRTNVEVWRIVRLLCLVCFLGAVGSLVWNLMYASKHVYLKWDLDEWQTNLKEATIQFFYLFLLLGNFIPVSLYVSMTIVKFCQSFFMKQDLDMYHEESDSPALVRTMALNEELGQVSHVFSDKTGTLTQNIMEFRKCCVGGVSYGRGVTDIGRAVAAEIGEEISKEDLEAELVISSRPVVPHVRFYDPRMEQDLQGAAGADQRALLQDFFVALAVCHTVIPERGAPRRRRRAVSRTGRIDTTSGHSKPSSNNPSGVFTTPSASLVYDSEIDPSMSERRSRERSMVERSMMDESGVRTDDEGDMEEEKWGEEQTEAEDEEQPKLSASSPDDEALVLGAKFFGMEFRDRVDNRACIRRSGPFVKGGHGQAVLTRPFAPFGMELQHGDSGPSYVDERYDVLRVLDFTSARKRMSVIVRDPMGRVRVLCKGADSVMIPRLAPIKSTSFMDDSPEGAGSRKRTLEHMERYAREGLRTLLVGSAELDRDWFVKWEKRFEAASTDLSEVDKKKKGLENEIDKLMNQVECNLRLLGCTAIEDKLQDGVGRTVRALQSAGVKVWMLTGDKEETAVNIGVACQLLPPENVMERIVVNMDPQTGCQDAEDVRKLLEDEVRRIEDERPRGSLKDPKPRALVIDGQALNLATQPLCRELLADLSMKCAAVIGCRVSPDQKREVVALVRETRPESRTLAIGDGANDVAMIQGAHIGIGISGQEGMQAVNSSDFAIAQFRFLRKLMLFHGRQNYRRMSKLVVYTFYKNVLMAVPMAWYVVKNGYSGQKFYTEVGIQMYNLLFTTLPVLFLGCFDRDVTLEDTERFPGLYVLGINDVFFNPKVFWSWMTQAIVEAAVITFVPLLLLTGGPKDFGTEQSLFFYGCTTFTLVVLVANSKVLWLQYRWTWWAAVLVIVSIVAWFGVACAATTLIEVDFDFFMVYFQLLANPTFWAVCALCVTAIAMRDLAWKFFHRWWQPKLHHIILEVEAKGRGEILNLSSEECVKAALRGGGRLSGVGVRGVRGRSRGIRIGGGKHRRGSSSTDLITTQDSDLMASAEVHSHAEPHPVFFPSRVADDLDDDSDARPPILEQLRAMEEANDGVEDSRFAKGGRRKRSSAVVTPAISQDLELGGGVDVGTGVDVEAGRAVGAEVVDTTVDVEVDLEVEKREVVPSASVWARSSSAERGHQTRGVDGSMNTRSWSWTMPPEKSKKPTTANVPSPKLISRSRSDQVKMRSQNTRSSQSILPLQYHAEGVGKGNAYRFSGPPRSLESEMILDYVELPLKKTPTFWEATGPTVDRIVRRRDSGLLSTGYGRWTQKSAAGAVGPRLNRETRSQDDGNVGAGSRASPGGSGTTGSRNRRFLSPPLFETANERRSKNLSDSGVRRERERGPQSRSSRIRSSGNARSDESGLSAAVAAPGDADSSVEERGIKPKSTVDMGRSEGPVKQGSFMERILGGFGREKT